MIIYGAFKAYEYHDNQDQKAKSATHNDIIDVHVEARWKPTITDG